MKTLACKDAGFDCGTVIRGESEEEIMRKAKEHATTEHNLSDSDMTPEFQNKIRGLIRSS
jgi:predicted small metal-binding protein